MMLKSVDLPAPLGPMTEKTSPARTSRLTPESAARAPKLFDTPSTASTISPVIPPPPGRVGSAARSPRRKPRSPCGAKSTIRTSTSPITIEYHCTYDDTFSWSRMKNAPPMMGPTSVPSPPIMTMMMNSPEMLQCMRSGVA